MAKYNLANKVVLEQIGYAVLPTTKHLHQSYHAYIKPFFFKRVTASTSMIPLNCTVKSVWVPGLVSHEVLNNEYCLLVAFAHMVSAFFFKKFMYEVLLSLCRPPSITSCAMYLTKTPLNRPPSPPPSLVFFFIQMHGPAETFTN